MRDPIRKQPALIGLVLAICVALRALRLRLVGIESPILTAWPSQVIFGFYFAILTLAIQVLQRLHEVTGRDFRRQALLLLAMIGVCLDMVLVNGQEVTGRVDASYGPVVLWDTATFFIWLRVVDLCRPGNNHRFRESWAVMVAPLFAFGREILFVPYGLPDAGLAYLDLLFGNILISLWVFLPFVRHERNRDGGTAERRLLLLVFTGCVYWLVSALENIIGLAWAPFYHGLYRVLQQRGLPIPILNCLQFVVAVGITLIVWHRDVLGIGARFGINRRRAPATSP
jgi:hypothetical protein